MDMAHTLPILVQFGGGALLCAVGIVAGITSGYLDMQVGEDRRAVFIIIGGYLGLLIFSCVFTYWLPYV